MNGLNGRATRFAIACLVMVAIVPATIGDLADVYLKNGLKFRGDVSTTADAVIVKNLAGEVRFSLADVARIVPLEPASTQPTTSPAQTSSSSTSAPSTQPATQPAEPGETVAEPDDRELSPAAPISKTDIQRLRLLELTLDGPAEVVRVRFKRKPRQKDLPTDVLDALRRRPDYRPEWEGILKRGQPYEKLQLILRETGLKYLDRIELLSDPEAFTRYQRKVLPLIRQSCARSGCHSGKAARVFRFPVGSTKSESYLYTSFVLLSQMQTRHGPLIDRMNPETSVLVSYLMQQEWNDWAHPPVTSGPSFKPIIRSTDDPRYADVIDWINFLMVPPPDYGLEYENPYPGVTVGPPAEPEEEQPADKSGANDARDDEEEAPADLLPTA